jgi:hypothetical protein
MSNKTWFFVVVLSLGLTACAHGAAAPQAPNGMVPYASEGNEADAIAAGVSPTIAGAASLRAQREHVAQNNCVQKENPWMR